MTETFKVGDKVKLKTPVGEIKKFTIGKIGEGRYPRVYAKEYLLHTSLDCIELIPWEDNPL